MSVVKRIGLVETDKEDRPMDDVKITKCTVKYEWISELAVKYKGGFFISQQFLKIES